MLNAASLRQQLVGDLKTAQQYSLEALEFFRAAGNPVNTAQSLLNLTDIALEEGRIEAAREYVRSGMEAIKATGSRYVEIQLFRTGALVELTAGDLDAAAAAAEQGIGLSIETGVPDFEPELYSTMGLVEMHRGNLESAVAGTNTAVEKLEAGTERPWLVHFRHFKVLAASGSPAEADIALSAAYQSLNDVLDGLDEDQRRAARRVPLHKEIIDAYQSVARHTATHRLVGVAVPTGRPVANHEWVQVEWTISEPADLAIADEVDRRRVRLLRLTEEAASQGGAPTIEDLAAALETSPTTVKRDLRSLRLAGHQIDTRGARRS
jgi:tetratricopeptide (TPR) repeat protein